MPISSCMLCPPTPRFACSSHPFTAYLTALLTAFLTALFTHGTASFASHLKVVSCSVGRASRHPTPSYLIMSNSSLVSSGDSTLLGSLGLLGSSLPIPHASIGRTHDGYTPVHLFTPLGTRRLHPSRSFLCVCSGGAIPSCSRIYEPQACHNQRCTFSMHTQYAH